jgi:hypothetical protein
MSQPLDYANSPRQSPKGAIGCLVLLLLSIIYIAVTILEPTTYRDRKGVSAVPEFINQPLSFAINKLGAPARDWSFPLQDAHGMPRSDISQRNPSIPSSATIREVSWDMGTTFITIWYRTDADPTVAVDAVQWDKRNTDWAQIMASPPHPASQPAQ